MLIIEVGFADYNNGPYVSTSSIIVEHKDNSYLVLDAINNSNSSIYIVILDMSGRILQKNEIPWQLSKRLFNESDITTVTSDYLRSQK